mgnify:CR=1 FL=1
MTEKELIIRDICGDYALDIDDFVSVINQFDIINGKSVSEE